MHSIPHDPFDLRYSSSGLLPDVGLRRRGFIYRHGPAPSHYWLFGILTASAVAVACLDWHTRAVVGELKYWVAGMILFAGVCDLLGTCLQFAFRQKVVIDAGARTLSIRGSGFMNDRFQCTLSWSQILELQVCRQMMQGHSEMNGYQLILTWRDADGSINRRCLLKHSIKRFVVRLGRQYQSNFGFPVVDYTNHL